MELIVKPSLVEFRYEAVLKERIDAFGYRRRITNISHKKILKPVLWAGSEIKAMPDFCIPPHPIPLPQGGEGTMCPEILLLHPVGGDGRGEGGHPPLKPDPLGPVVYCFDYDRICFNG